MKLIGTVIDWPVESEIGSDGGELPNVNADPAISNDVTVVGAEAVKVAVALVDCDTTVVAKLGFDPVSAGVAEGSAPKASRVSSLVPT